MATRRSDGGYEPTDVELNQAVFAALDDGELIDNDAFERAVDAITASHKLGVVLAQWAAYLACAHRSGSAAFPDDLEGVSPRVVAHARGLVNAARPTNPSFDPLDNRLLRILRELTDIELWTLMELMARQTSQVLAVCGGFARVVRVTNLVIECIDRVDETQVETDRYVPAIGPISLALAAISHGQYGPANDYLALSISRSGIKPHISILFALGATVLSRTADTIVDTIVETDAQGHLQAIHPTRVGDRSDPQTAPINRARDLLHAIQTRDSSQVDALVTEINGLSGEDLNLTSWHLALSLGVRIGHVEVARHQPRPT